MYTVDAARAAAKGLPITSIRTLYRVWEEKHRQLSKGGFTEAELSALIDETDALADNLLAIPAESSLDLVAKFLAASDKMEVSIREEWEDSIRDEALAFLNGGAA